MSRQPVARRAGRGLKDALLILLAAIILVMLVGLRYRTVSRDNERVAHERLTLQAKQDTALIGDTLAATFSQVETLQRMAALVTEAVLAGDAGKAQELLRLVGPASDIMGPDVLQLAAIGPDGIMLWSSLNPNPPRTDLHEREHFRALADHPDRDGWIGRPVLGKVSGEWSINVARAMRDGARHLRAVTVISVRVSMLRRLSARTALDSLDRVALLRDDGVVLMRNDMTQIGESVPQAPGIEWHPDGTAVFERVSPLDREPRLVAVRRLPEMGLELHVGLSLRSRRAVIDGMNESLWASSLLADAAILAAALLSVLLLTQMRRTAMQSARASAAAESQRWFRAVIDNMPDGALVLDNVDRGDFSIAFASRRAEDILGLPANTLAGDTLHRFVMDGTGDRAGTGGERILAADGQRFTLRRADGRAARVTINSIVAPKPDNSSERQAILLLQDVTEQESRDLALTEARAQIDRMLQVLPGVFYRSVRNPQDQYYHGLYISDGVREMFGVDPQTALAPGLLSRATGLDLTTLREAALAQAGQRQIVTLDYRFMWQGRPRWVRDTLRHVARSDGRHEIVGFMADATEQRETEEALRGAVQFGPGVLYRARVDAQTGVSDVLGAYGEASRISGAADAGVPTDPGWLARYFRETGIADALRAAGEQPSSQDVPMLRDGITRWIRHSFRAAGRGEGSIDVVGYLVDITQEKNEQLRMQQVTTLLTLGEMATGMAHELNQPLASISFAAQNAGYLLDDGAAGLDQVRGKLGKIEAEANRAAQLVRHMRIFARNERTQPRPVRWQDALAGALEILQVRLRGCALIDALPGDLPPVMGAAIPMEQILINLIGNALDAYEHSTADSFVIAIEGTAHDGHVVLRVRDRAGGIPPHVLPRIFDPFFTTKDVGKGTGLGLALVFGTVTDMGGTVVAFNQGAGAVFEITLPAAPASAPDSAAPDSAGAAAAAQPATA